MHIFPCPHTHLHLQRFLSIILRWKPKKKNLSRWIYRGPNGTSLDISRERERKRRDSLISFLLQNSQLLHFSWNNPSFTSLFHRLLLFILIHLSSSFFSSVSLCLNGVLQPYTAVIRRLSFSSLTSCPAVCRYVHAYTQNQSINSERL